MKQQASGLAERAVELWAKEPAPDAETRFERSRVLALLGGLGGEANPAGPPPASPPIPLADSKPGPR